MVCVWVSVCLAVVGERNKREGHSSVRVFPYTGVLAPDDEAMTSPTARVANFSREPDWREMVQGRNKSGCSYSFQMHF